MKKRNKKNQQRLDRLIGNTLTMELINEAIRELGKNKVPQEYPRLVVPPSVADMWNNVVVDNTINNYGKEEIKT